MLRPRFARRFDPTTEASFRHEQLPADLLFLRITYVWASVADAVEVYILEPLLVGTGPTLAVPLAYHVRALVCLAPLLLTFTGFGVRWRRPLAVTTAWVFTLAVAAELQASVGYLGASVATGLRLLDLVVTVFAVYTVARIGPALASATGAVCIGIWGAAVWMFAPLDWRLLATYGTYLLVFVAIAALFGFILESHTREGFLQRRAIEAERRRSESLLLNILPAPIAARLKTGEEPIADGYDEVSVLFADIVDFTGIASRSTPHRVVHTLNGVFSEFDRLAARYELEKIKTIGDAYMVVGGLPEPRPDHAEAVAEMALEMLATLEGKIAPTGEPIRVRIGIHTGPVVAGVIGTTKFAYDLWGDTVNTASRMESHGIGGSIQVSATTYDRLKSRYALIQRGTVSVKGKGDMITYLLVGRREGRMESHVSGR